jgi:Cu/Ag efflux protein CusF
VPEFNWKICYVKGIVKTLTLVTRTLILTAVLALVGCGTVGPGSGSDSGAQGASGQTAIKRYPMHGKVLALMPADKKARIDAGPIGDWMPAAMTMNYPVRDDAEFAKLAVGQTIDVTVFVKTDDDYWIGEIKPSK